MGLQTPIGESRRETKSVTFTGLTNAGRVGSVPLFTVTGRVKIESIVAYCSDSLGVSAGVGTASIQLGFVGTTNAFIATTNPTAIDVGEFWVDNAPDLGGVAIPAAMKDIALAANIVAEVTNNEAADAEISTLTFPTFAGATTGDYIVITSQSGITFAIYLDKTGASAAPTGAAYTAVAAGRKSRVDISGDTTAAQVAARAELALNALTGFTALMTTDDTAADGTMTITQTAIGTTTNPVPHNENDSGAGSITTAETNSGTSTNDLTCVNSGTLDVYVIYRPLSADGSLVAA